MRFKTLNEKKLVCTTIYQLLRPYILQNDRRTVKCIETAMKILIETKLEEQNNDFKYADTDSVK